MKLYSTLCNNSTSESAEVTIYYIIGNKMGVINLALRNNSTTFGTALSNGIYFLHCDALSLSK